MTKVLVNPLYYTEFPIGLHTFHSFDGLTLIYYV